MDQAEEGFADVVQALVGEPGVTPPGSDSGAGRRFGSNGLKVGGKVFAMLVRGKLVVKLPRERAAELIAAGLGEAFDAGKGRPMKEWVTALPVADGEWLGLAREALAFVRGAR